ncbi:MAG: MoaD/ThiS family protein [Clostridiales Family XIII bacterium]|jgi:molybdopterin converting factor small subunit|nr:MoaD/ThiS family protein [Clostridiales Family XIII bacterium]
MAKVLIPTALRAFTEGKSEAEVSGKTAGEVIAALAKTYPDLKQHLFDEGGKLRSFVNVFVGDENIKNFGGLDAPVSENETVTLVPAIAGGNADLCMGACL